MWFYGIRGISQVCRFFYAAMFYYPVSFLSAVITATHVSPVHSVLLVQVHLYLPCC